MNAPKMLAFHCYLIRASLGQNSGGRERSLVEDVSPPPRLTPDSLLAFPALEGKAANGFGHSSP
jgi:hypothetical protein